MDLSRHYAKLYGEGIAKIRNDQYQLDDQIDSLLDTRLGITLIIRPTIEIKNKIQSFLVALKTINPGHYYYPNTDIHITVMSIISCYEGFDLKDICVADYVTCIEKSLDGINKIEINFKGITLSASAIMIQGFVNTTGLDALRNNLRATFKNSGLEESIDKRYSISTAHSTVVRFRKDIRDNNDLR